MAKQRLTPDEYYQAIQEPHKSIALEARLLLCGTEPDVIEEMKFGVPFYSRQGMVCYMNINKSGVTIGFICGTQMSDTFGLFSGKSTKLVRHIALPNVDFIRENHDKITNYVIEALVINDSKAKK